MTAGDLAPLLTVELLDALKARWAERQLPIVDELAAGLSAPELAAAAADQGWSLNAELRTWWSWHNGETYRGRGHFGPRWLSIEAARSEAAIMAEVAESSYEPELGSSWTASWVPITANDSGGLLVCDLSRTPDNGPGRMLYVENGVTYPSAFMTDSLGKIVTWWIELYDRNLYNDDGTVDDSDPSSFPGPEQYRFFYAN